MNTNTKLRALLSQAHSQEMVEVEEAMYQIVDLLPALLDRLDKLEAVAEAARHVEQAVLYDTDDVSCGLATMNLLSALAALNSKLGETE